MQLQPYNYEIVYLKDNSSLLSDTLSRAPVGMKLEEHQIRTVHFELFQMHLKYDDNDVSCVLKRELLNSDNRYIEYGQRQYKYTNDMILTKFNKERKWKILVPKNNQQLF